MWNRFISWAGLHPIEATSLRDRAAVVGFVLTGRWRRDVRDPIVKALHQSLPVAFLKLRLRRQGEWWRVPSDAVGVHASRRLSGGYALRAGDLIKIDGDAIVDFENGSVG